MNPALRLCEPEGLTAAGLENSLADAAGGNLVETVNPSVPVGYGSPAGLGMVYRPSDLASGRAIVVPGGAERWKPIGSNESSRRYSQRMSKATAVSWGEMR